MGKSRKKEKLTVIRTAAGCLSAAGMIIELKKKGIRVVGLDCNPLSAGFYLCDKHYAVPQAGDPRFLKEILRICDRERPRMIISGPEEEVLIFSQNKNLFEKRGIIPLVPPEAAVKIAMDKIKTHEFFEQNDVPAPKRYSPANVEFPCLAKPIRSRGGRDITLLKNEQELNKYIETVPDYLLEEYIKGDEYTIDIFSDLEANPLSIVPRIRLGIESGISVKGKTIYDKEMIDYCAKIARALKLTGPACFQCLRNGKGIKFIEINPRFGGGSILSLKADPSIINNMVRLMEGMAPLKSKGFKEGLTMLRYYSEVYV